MQIEILKQDALVDVQFSSAFLQRLQELLAWFINQDLEKVRTANEKLTQDNNELDEWEEHYITLLTLTTEIETASKQQGKTELVAIPDTPKESI